MGQVSGEIVGAELVAGVVALLDQVGAPLLQGGPVGLGKGSVLLGGRGSGCGHQHVAALLHRHLPLGAGAVAVDLAVDDGVAARVVGGEVIEPDFGFRILENGAQHTLDQLGVVDEEEGDGGVGHVDRSGAAVTEALLGNEEHLALGVVAGLVRADDLAVGEGQQLGVLFVSRGGHGVVPDGLGEGLAAGENGLVVGEGLLDGGLNRAVGLPPAAVHRLVKIFEGVDVVVSDREEGRAFAQVGRHADVVGRGAVLVDQVDGGHGGVLSRNRAVEIAPVDAQVVARFIQGMLEDAAHLGAGQAGDGHRLVRGGELVLEVLA